MKFSNLSSFSKHIGGIGATSDFFPQLFLLLSKEGRDTSLARQMIRKKIKGDFKGVVSELSFDRTHTSERIREEIESLSFFSPQKIFFIRDGESLSKDVWKLLLEAPGRGTLFFVLEGASGNHSFYKECEKKGVVLDLAAEKSWEREKELKRLIEERVAKEGKSIDSRAATLLAARGEMEYTLLFQEIEKLIVYCLNKTTITLEDFFAVIPYQKSVSPYAFSEAVFERNLESARFEMVMRLVQEPIIVLIKQLRSQVQTTLKVASILRASQNKEAVTSHFPYMRGAILERQLKNVENWPIPLLLEMLVILDSMEMMAKESTVDEPLLADLLLIKLFSL